MKCSCCGIDLFVYWQNKKIYPRKNICTDCAKKKQKNPVNFSLQGAKGIYCIKNIFNGRVYIGSTAVSFHERWSRHRRDLEKGSHHSYKLQADWDLFGSIYFKFLILEDVPEIKNILFLEQYYLDYFDAVELGYNICKTAGSCVGVKRSDEVRGRMRVQALKRVEAERKKAMQRKIINLEKLRKYSPTLSFGQIKMSENGKVI